MKERFAAIFATKTRAEWEEVFAGSDACAAPVLSSTEAPDHPHNKARSTFVEVAGVVQPAPSPRFLSTPGAIRRPPPNPGQHADEALATGGCRPTTSLRCAARAPSPDLEESPRSTGRVGPVRG